MTSTTEHDMDIDMRVTKRNGDLEIMSFDKILNRIKIMGRENNIQINYTSLAMKVIDQLYDKIPTTKLDELTAEQCASLSTQHPDYGVLGSCIIISNYQKNTNPSFVQVMQRLYEFRDDNGIHCPLVSKDIYTLTQLYGNLLECMIVHERDYLIDYFGFKTLERSYLFKINDVNVERIQHMWLRVALGIHGNDLTSVQETYDLMSQKYFTHATPTLFNAGTPKPQLSSCYLVGMEDDSLEGIFNTLKDCASISKWAGGIGLHIHNIRANNSLIRGTNGKSNGIVPMLKVFNDTARFINQGGKRNGSFAIYLEPWHADVEDFLDLKKNHGDEEQRARDLFYALWIPDLFMERVKENGNWSLFCPNECPGLADVYGDDFKTLYTRYENTPGKVRKTITARELWLKVLDSQMETGTPYLLYKDAANRKSNQQNLGTIKSSNLCVAPETLILTDVGHVEIQSVVGRNVNVWNGVEFSEVTVFKTGTNQELVEIITDDGCTLNCTPYHKFYIQNTLENPIPLAVEAKDLHVGDEIIACEYPVIDGPEPIERAYTRGFFTEPSSFYKNTDALQFFQGCSHTLDSKLEWFAGYCDANVIIEDIEKLQVCCISNDFLIYLKLMLQTCGVNPIVSLQNHHLILSSTQLQKLVSLGFSPKRLNIVESNTNTNTNTATSQIVRIAQVKYTKRKSDTYCFTEPNRHAGIFNGIITSQCIEIIEYSDENESAVCNLASIALPAFVNPLTREFNYELLHKVTKVVTKNLNKVIDINFYPTEKTIRSNLLHRPIGIGIQGLADTFILMDIAFHSDAAKDINKMIFETMYHASLEQSNELAIRRMEGMKTVRCQVPVDEYRRTSPHHMVESYIKLLPLEPITSRKDITDLRPIIAEIVNIAEDNHAGAYSSFEGSPASKGILQFDMWDVEPTDARYNWTNLKMSIQKYGLRNSLLIAPMPTASTSQILGYNECFEPLTSNIYSRRTLAGEFVVANKYLMRELIELGLWNEDIKNNIIANRGSIQQLVILSEHMRNKYKIVWEIPMKHLIDMSADRGAFICQSQSLNLWLEDPNYNMLTSMHFYSWKKGLKSGIYYLRRKGKHQAQQFTLEPKKTTSTTNKEEDAEDDDNDENKNDDICEMCSA